MLDAEFQQLGVKAVVTLNEEFEIFISLEQYAAAGITHLHLLTIDFLYAPPVGEMHRGVDFIHEHAARGELVYVHCKAGRSTSLVLCYLVKHHAMAPAAALEQTRSKRQQVHLSPVTRGGVRAGAPHFALMDLWAGGLSLWCMLRLNSVSYVRCTAAVN
jgi:atypical dual specificity phosphatase